MGSRYPYYTVSASQLVGKQVMTCHDGWHASARRCSVIRNRFKSSVDGQDTGSSSSAASKPPSNSPMFHGGVRNTVEPSSPKTCHLGLGPLPCDGTRRSAALSSLESPKSPQKAILELLEIRTFSGEEGDTVMQAPGGPCRTEFEKVWGSLDLEPSARAPNLQALHSLERRRRWCWQRP